MRKTIYLFSVLALSVLPVLFGTGCTAKVKAATHLRRAERYFLAGQYDRAEIEYKIVLRNDPQNSKAWGRLGVIYFEDGRLSEAVPVLSRAEQLDANNLEARVKLGTIELVTGHQNEAEERASFVLSKDPSDLKAPVLLAEAASTNQIPDTFKRLQAMFQQNETAPLAVALGTIATRQHDFLKAGTEFQRALKLDPKFSDAYSALGTLYAVQKDQKRADQLYKTAAELAAPRSGKGLQYAQFKFATGDTNTAQQVLQQLVKQAPDYLPAWLELAQFAASGQNYADAATFLANVLTRDPGNFDGLLLQGRLNLLQGQTSQAILEFQRMTEIYPAVPAVRYQLALAYIATNKADTAVACLNQAISMNPQFADAILLLAQIQIQRGHLDSAMASLRRLIEQQPKLVTARLLMANAYRVQGDWDSAIQTLRELEAGNPDNQQLHLLLGIALMQKKRNAEARSEFDEAMRIAPDFLPALEQLVNLDLTGKNYAAALRRVQSTADKSPQQVELRLLTAKILLAEGDHDQAEASLQKTIELAPENQTAYLMLAQIYHDTGKNKEALAKLDAAVARDPHDITALMLSSVIYDEEKAYGDAAKTYEKLLKVNPRFGPALNNLAYLYSESIGNRLDRAYELAQEARDLMPYDPSMADTLGWICFKRGSFTLAMTLLQESAAKLPDQPDVQFHLGMACYMTGDETDARTAFHLAMQGDRAFAGRDECGKCLSVLGINAEKAGASDREFLEKRVLEKPDDPGALNRLAIIYRAAGNLPKAVAACEAVLKTNPNNLGALLELAGIYAATDINHACELVQSAYKLAPENVEVCRLYGNLAGQSRDYKLAANLLQLAVQHEPDNAGLLFDYAQAADRVGRLNEAQNALQDALARNLPAEQSAEAQRMLDLLKVAVSSTSASDSAAQVSEILKTQPDYLPALAAAARISESQGDLVAARATGEKILTLYPDFAPAERQLAWLYAGDSSQTDRAYTLALKAREVYPEDPFVAKTLGIILLQKGDVARAVNLLRESAASSADAEAFFYLGTSQYKLNQRSESKESLKRALDLKLTGKQAQAAKQMLQALN